VASKDHYPTLTFQQHSRVYGLSDWPLNRRPKVYHPQRT